MYEFVKCDLRCAVGHDHIRFYLNANISNNSVLKFANNNANQNK